jgi:hypothetical protein
LPLDLTEAERVALLNLLTETIETSRYPLSPRMQTLRAILAKLGPATAIGRWNRSSRRDLHRDGRGARAQRRLAA